VFPVSFNGRRRGRRVLVPAFLTLLAVSLLKTTAAVAQDATGPQQAKPGTQSLPPINVSGPQPVQRTTVKPRPGGAATAVRVPRRQPQPSLQPRPSPPTQPLAGIPMTPLNDVPQSATRLGLPVIQTPASVEIVTQRTIQEQGYRSTTDTAQGGPDRRTSHLAGWIPPVWRKSSS
jgi:iron complex outermembrane recepter protein